MDIQCLAGDVAGVFGDQEHDGSASSANAVRAYPPTLLTSMSTFPRLPMTS